MTGVQRNKTCRNRIIEQIGKSAEGKARLAAHEARVDRHLAEHIEHEEKGRAPTAPGGHGEPEVPRARSLQPYEPLYSPEAEVAPSHPQPRDAGTPEYFQGNDISIE